MSRPLTEEEEAGVNALVEAVCAGQVSTRTIEHSRAFCRSQIMSWIHSARVWRQYHAREDMYESNRDLARTYIRNARVNAKALHRLGA